MVKASRAMATRAADRQPVQDSLSDRRSFANSAMHRAHAATANSDLAKSAVTASLHDTPTVPVSAAALMQSELIIRTAHAKARTRRNPWHLPSTEMLSADNFTCNGRHSRT